MKLIQLRSRLAAGMLCACCALVLGACAADGPAYTAPALPPLRAGTIARLVVDGPNAFVNGQRVQTGAYIVDGDTVTTGPGTSALLKLNDGGEIQLDENTDPLFTQGACLLLKIVRGKVAMRNLKCQEFEDRFQMKGVARSFVHIESGEDASRVTVLAGEVDMRSPRQATLGPDTQYIAGRDGTGQVLPLTPQETIATVAWMRKYFRAQPSARSRGLSDAEAAAMGGVAGALLDFLLRDRTRSGSGRLPPPQDNTRPVETRPLPDPQPVPERGQEPQTPPVPVQQPVPGRVEQPVPVSDPQPVPGRGEQPTPPPVGNPKQAPRPAEKPQAPPAADPQPAPRRVQQPVYPPPAKEVPPVE